MLDDFAHEMDTTESKMDNVMKKMAKSITHVKWYVHFKDSIWGFLLVQYAGTECCLALVLKY